MYGIVSSITRGSCNNSLICIDSYEDGILQGRIYNPHQEPVIFDSLSQFLIKMENLLDDLQHPQAYMSPRRFHTPVLQIEHVSTPLRPPKGDKATFMLHIRFRQHTSWQGTIHWKEQHLEQSFRSVLELILLMDSALQETGRRQLA